MKKLILSVSGIAIIALSSASFADTAPKGIYSGKFGEGKATIFINSVQGNQVKGYSLYLHNKRPVTGTLKSQGYYWKFKLNEPATRIGDGQFDIITNREEPDILIGRWRVFSKSNTKAGIPAKNFSLHKTNCDFKANEGYYSHSSYRLLSDDELFEPPEYLDYVRNEIYARHGYSFKSKKWASTFAKKDWYVPCYTSVTDKLNSIEKQNIKRLKEMSEYMTNNPQDWGR